MQDHASERPDPAAAAGLPPAPGKPPRVWLHVAARGCAEPLAGLAAHLASLRPALGLILTHAVEVPAPEALPPGCLCFPGLPEGGEALAAALASWAPGVILLGAGPLPRRLLEAAARGAVPVVQVDAGAPEFRPGDRGWPGWQRRLLRRLHRIVPRDETAAQAWRRAGALPMQLEPPGTMAGLARPLPCAEAERAALATAIGVRPVWCAMVVPETEEAAVLEAHRLAQRMAHRLLLILVPADPGRGPALEQVAAAHGLRAARRSADADPGEDDQVYVADTEDERGLWYRLAPICFMGGTLAGAGPDEGEAPGTGAAAVLPSGPCPLEAAALGAAIVHGPFTAGHAGVYRALLRARAAWRVPDAEALSSAVVDLLAPDRAAAMASGRWSVATQGAEVTDRVARMVLEALDRAAPVRGRG